MFKQGDNNKTDFSDQIRGTQSKGDTKIMFDKTGTYYSFLNKCEVGNISERACFIPGSEKPPLAEEEIYSRTNTSNTNLYDKIAQTYNRENVEKNARKIQKQLNTLNSRTYGTKPQDIKNYLYDLEIENELSDQLIILECLYLENEGIPLNTKPSNFEINEPKMENFGSPPENKEEFDEIFTNFTI